MPDKDDVSKMSAATFQREFHLDSVFDYVKTGIGSIIEDEVTQRFVAEELKVSLEKKWQVFFSFHLTHIILKKFLSAARAMQSSIDKKPLQPNLLLILVA